MSQIKVNAVTDASGGNTATINSMTPTADSLQGFRNRIINGDMRIDQRNAGAAVTINTAGNTYTIDRWRGYGTGSAGVFTMQRSTSTPPSGFTNFLRTTVTTIDSSLAAADFYGISQAIEGFNIADLGWGASGAKTVTLSFWIRSSLTGTFNGSLNANPASSASYVFTYTINSANTWEYKTLTIAGPTSGTFPTDNTAGFTVWYSFAMGSDYTTSTVNSWQAAARWGSSSSVNVMATLNATVDITGVQLEVGSVATPFERRPYGTELALCQRYYYRTNPESSGRIAVGFTSATTTADLLFFLPVTMRIAPTALEQSGTAADYVVVHLGTSTASSSVPILQTGTNITTAIRATVSSGLTQGNGCQLRTANTNGYLGWSAEL